MDLDDFAQDVLDDAEEMLRSEHLGATELERAAGLAAAAELLAARALQLQAEAE